MAECKNCISEPVCKYKDEKVSVGTDVKDTIHNCKDFKDKENFVEVVRCEKCKNYEPHGNGKAGMCGNKKCTGLRYATDSCSYGERKESE